MKNIHVFASLLLLVILPVILWARKEKSVSAEHPMTKVLIIGFRDNVKSNYYYNEVIARETGMQIDSIDHLYNAIIARNIARSTAYDRCQFISGTHDQVYDRLAEKIAVKGEGESCVSDLSGLSPGELQEVLEYADAQYLLVLNQHYLKWQYEPMRTVFHMVSYTLYDKDKKTIHTGSQYFTSMNLEPPERIIQLSRKSTAKIASGITKALAL
jgi:hypothetical protein